MSNETEVICMYLFKAFDTISHELLITNINFYGLKQHAFDFFSSFLVL